MKTRITAKALRKLVIQGVRSGPTVEPRCPHAIDCGGCAFQDRAYDYQLTTKTTVLHQLFGFLADKITLDVETITVKPSPDPYAYRTRMDYVTTKGRLGLRKSGRFQFIVELETCHLLPPAAFQAVQAVWLQARELGLDDYNVRSHEGFLRYLVVRRSPQDTFLLAAVTAAGDAHQEMDALAAIALAQPGVVSFHWLRNDSLSDVSFGVPVQHWGSATLPMELVHPDDPEQQMTLHIGPNTFFQNNVHLLWTLLDDVAEAAVGDRADSTTLQVIDLYSGVGAIAMYLSPHVAQMTCVESHTESAALTRYNSSLNRLPVTVWADDVQRFLQLQRRGQFDVAIVDPPRTGLGERVCLELQRMAPQRIVYLSCNPITQLDDLQLLTASYQLTTLQGYDMFPHTPHVETLAVLDANEDSGRY
ncbi:MAG: class I SAM-dependent RNA methyltransferase [Chloroflexaceae bacterium]|nr:class I SAM-dependent RNA methyltransferase [Chloroflexaceae bacterium]